jgi:hypothetical protein
LSRRRELWGKENEIGYGCDREMAIEMERMRKTRMGRRRGRKSEDGG